MLRFLFPRLTSDQKRGADLYRWVSDRARDPEWYRAGEVPDTVDGRFAVLATIAALVAVRLEREDGAGAQASVALTERFVEVMEAEHREMGLGDPKLGRTVRKLVGSLGRRVELWRDGTAGDWSESTRISIYGGEEPSLSALKCSAEGLAGLRQLLDATPIDDIVQGRIG